MPSKREQIKPAIVQAVKEGNRSVKGIVWTLKHRDVTASASTVRAACEELCDGEEPVLENAGWGRKVRYRFITPERRAAIVKWNLAYKRAKAVAQKLDELGFESVGRRGANITVSVEDAERLLTMARITISETEQED